MASLHPISLTVALYLVLLLVVSGQVYDNNVQQHQETPPSTPSPPIVHYNIPDPDCHGAFGLCTQEDKDRLGYAAIVKLHEQMDDDHDGKYNKYTIMLFLFCNLNLLFY